MKSSTTRQEYYQILAVAPAFQTVSEYLDTVPSHIAHIPDVLDTDRVVGRDHQELPVQYMTRSREPSSG